MHLSDSVFYLFFLTVAFISFTWMLWVTLSKCSWKIVFFVCDLGWKKLNSFLYPLNLHVQVSKEMFKIQCEFCRCMHWKYIKEQQKCMNTCFYYLLAMSWSISQSNYCFLWFSLTLPHCTTFIQRPPVWQAFFLLFQCNETIACCP